MIGKEEFWLDAKNELSKIMQTISYDVWIDKLEPLCFIDDTFVLVTLTASSKRTIDERYLDTITGVVSSLNKSVSKVEVITPDKKQEYLQKQTDFLPGGGIIVDNKKKTAEVKTKNPFVDRYTFENFVMGKSNTYALMAAKTVAENAGGKYNPLFIYSGVGLGKTHLLHAIGNYLRNQSPKTKVVYVNSEQMVSEFVQMSMKRSNTESNQFREKYRSCDVLMVDDVQFLAKREQTQEALFHIFNDLYQANKQIILTSDRSPKELVTLEERLRTRFAWGLTVDINVPDTETRIAILRTKAAQEKFRLSDEVATFIAENCTSNIREMEGLLNKIIFFSSLTNHVIDTTEMAREALQDFIEEKKDTLDASDIIDTVCKYFNIAKSDIFSKKKTKNIVEPRMIAIYLITEMLGLPLVTIGQMFGGRDHTTIIHARDKISEMIKTDKRMKIVVADIKNMILNR